MTATDRNYLFALINILLVVGGIMMCFVIFSRTLQEPPLDAKGHLELVQNMTEVHKLKEMVIRDNVYIRSLESFAHTSRAMLLFSSSVGAAFGLINLVLVPWRRKHSRDGSGDFFC